VGTVVSDKMDKTVVVSVERVFAIPFMARLRRTVKFKAHDENNECRSRGSGAHYGDQTPEQAESGGG
jgi:ribosomal protein S17